MPRISQLVSHSRLGLRLIHAGTGDHEITWAPLGDLWSVAPYLQGGEFVLTQGAELETQEVNWRDIVATLSRAQIAAIGFGLGPHHSEIPQPLVAAASTYRVALVEIPAETSLIEVTQTIALLRKSDELVSTRETLRAQQRILDLAFDGTGIAGIVSAVSSATDRQVAVVEPNGNKVASTAGFLPQTVDESLNILEVGSGRSLIVGGPPLDPEGAAAMTAAAIVLSVENRSHTHNTVLERERWGRLARAALLGESNLQTMAHVLDPTFALPSRVRVVAVQGSAEAVAAWRSEPRVGLDRLVTRYPVDSATPNSPVAGVVLAWQITEPGQHLDEALSLIAAHELDAVVGTETDVVSSELSRRSAQLRLDALSSIEQLYQSPRVPTVLWADRDSPILDLLLSQEPRSLVTGSVLGPLSLNHVHTHPAPKSLNEHQELRETLASFLQHHGQRGPCAEDLGIHRNTLRGRITRIETMLGKSLENPDDRAQLWLALRSQGVAS